MITVRHAGFLIALLVAGFGSARADTAKQAPVIIDLRAHREEIRTVLSRYTPIGSELTKVLEFVSKQLQRDGNGTIAVENKSATGPTAEKSGKRGVKRIRAYLGQYYDHPEVVFYSTPLLMEKEVSAQWAFDQNDRLIDIFVDKRNELY